MTFRAWNNFPAGAGQVVRSNLFLLGHKPFWAGQMSFIEDYPIALCSKIHADCSNNTLQHNTPYSWVCGDDFISQLPENEKPLLPPRRAGLLKFCTVAEPWNSGKSGKSCEIDKNTRNIAQLGRNLTEYMSFQHIWEFRLMELFFAVHLQIYLETSSLQRENIPKLQGVLRLLWQKTGLWPVHDIKRFAIDTFLSSLLLKK